MRVGLAGAAVLTASLAHATASGTLEVWQPIVNYPDPVVVLYEDWFGIFGYPAAIRYTTQANTMMVRGRPENRNAASLLGIRVDLVGASARSFSTNADFFGLGVFGDTAKVVLDLSSAQLNSPIVAHTLHQTIDCILLNARRSWPTVRFVGLDVVGSDEFAPCSGTYGLELVPAGCATGWRGPTWMLPLKPR